MKRLYYCLWILGIAMLALPDAHAQQGGIAFEWIARTSEADPNLGLNLDALLQPREGKLRQIVVDRGLVKVSELSNGRWTTVREARHQMAGRYIPRVARSFDQHAAYLWNFDDELRIFRLGEQGSPAPLLSIQDPRLRTLMNLQGAGRVSGDAGGMTSSRSVDLVRLFENPAMDADGASKIIGEIDMKKYAEWL